MNKINDMLPANPESRNKRRLSRHTGKWLSAASARIPAIVLLISFLLTGCASGSFSGDASQPSSGNAYQIEDGVLSGDGATLEFEDSDDAADAVMTVLEPDEDEAPDGLASDLFQLDMGTVYEDAVTIAIPYDGECPVDDDEAELVLGIGTTVELDAGGADTFYTYIPADLDDGVATAEFTPADYAEMAVHGDASTGTSAPYKERTSLGLFWITSTYKDGGHFKVYMPLQAHTFYLDYNERCALLDDLEAVYNDYIGKGYTYSKRSDWPMNVTLKNLQTWTQYATGTSGALGYYSYGNDGAQGQIYLNRSLLDNGYTAGALNPLLAHEFFHFVQLNYVDVGADLLWFDEATATYFESTKMSNAVPSIVAQYKELIFSGVFPEDNTAANGYCRMPLIKFLAGLRGEEFILNAYKTAGQGADWDSTLNSAAGPPAVWTADFYQALVTGKVSDYAPFTIYSNLADGKASALGTSVALVMPEADEIAQLLEDGDPVALGKTTLSTAAFGAQLAAITIDEENLKLLPDGTDPVVKLSGADGDLRVFAIRGKNVQTASDTGGGVSLKDFKDATGNKYIFLALVTNLSDSTQDFEMSVEVEPFPTLDELVGVYNDGCMTYTEVFISDALRAEAAAEAAEPESDDDSEDDLGCDLNLDIIAAIDNMEGTSQYGQIIIEKTGENTGTFFMKTPEMDEAGDEDDFEPMTFTYENGYLDFGVIEQDDYTTEGRIAARYGKNNDVVIDGTFTVVVLPDEFWIELRYTGSKPLETT